MFERIIIKRVRINGRYFYQARDRKTGRILSNAKWSSDLRRRTKAFKEVLERAEKKIRELEEREDRIITKYLWTTVTKHRIAYYSINSYLTLKKSEFTDDEDNFLNEIHRIFESYYEQFMDIGTTNEGMDDCEGIDFGELEELLIDCNDAYGKAASYVWDIEKDGIKYYVLLDWLEKEIIDAKLPEGLAGEIASLLRRWGFR
jgi:hypothetical protein